MARAARRSCCAPATDRSATPSAALPKPAPSAAPCSTPSRPLERSPHELVRDPGLFVLTAFRAKALAQVKPERVHLGRKDDFPVAPRARLLEQATQQQCSDAALAPWLEHGHAADVRIGQKARGADGLVAVERERV